MTKIKLNFQKKTDEAPGEFANRHVTAMVDNGDFPELELPVTDFDPDVDKFSQKLDAIAIAESFLQTLRYSRDAFRWSLLNYSQASVILSTYNQVVGTEDVDALAQTSRRTQDPVLMVGNGQSSQPSNALVVLKRGEVQIPISPLKVDGCQVLTADSPAIALSVGTASTGALLAMGSRSTATSPYSLAMGFSGNASADAAMTFRWFATALGRASFAAGDRSMASGLAATAVGSRTNAGGNSSFAGRALSGAPVDHAFAFDYNAQAKAVCSVAMGEGSMTEGSTSVALDRYECVKAPQSFATGYVDASHDQSSVDLGHYAAVYSD